MKTIIVPNLKLNLELLFSSPQSRGEKKRKKERKRNSTNKNILRGNPSSTNLLMSLYFVFYLPNIQNPKLRFLENQINNVPATKWIGQQKANQRNSIQIMNVYECNGTNIFMRWKMKCFIQRSEAELNETFHVSPNENICFIARMRKHSLFVSYNLYKDS